LSSTELYLGRGSDESDDAEPKYRVRLPIFDGPLDLLLHLIRKNEVEIYDIPIAEITKQYLEILELMEELELNLNLAGEFLVMAATLIHIKSKMLLPPPHEDGTEDEENEDPRAVLVARLLEYERYKEAAQQLHQQEEIRNATWVRPDTVDELAGANGSNGAGDLLEVDLFELISAFREVLERVRQRADLVYEREGITIEEMIQRLDTRLEATPQCTFVELFDDAVDRAMVIVTFLAILEMVRVRKLKIYQQQLFGTIHVMRLSDDG
jgi:segregation and condensation protein A